MVVPKLAKFLICAGGVIVTASVIWWASYYGALGRQLAGLGLNVVGGSGLNLVGACLFWSTYTCNLVNVAASFGGRTPYSPMVFWIGIAVVIAGVTVALSHSLKVR